MEFDIVNLYLMLRKKFTAKKFTSLMDDDNQFTIGPETVEYTLILDCCDIEAAVNRIFNELIEAGTFESLTKVVQEYEEASTSFEKHQKILESKRKSIEEQKKVLSELREKQGPLQKVYETAPGKKPELSEDNLSLVKQWMECRIESKKEFYEYLIGEVRDKTESFTQDLDLLLRKIFDDWASKKREISVLKKYRNFNLEKIERVTKQIAQKEEVIETDRMEKEKEIQREREILKRRLAATLIQAYWRGTMVRKHLGPYKIKKPKKKGKKDKKGKKKGKK
ncbi:dynein regulatory complex protein 9-like isoform X3 [Argiope bruennichi]|uniref:dynein regulatory complex protein 9-like isoform X3 n=1 Tax=Argiope bruennichi TaxID=94029 RepID=UPI0024945454|nr:dynein regulatory complex protein 9-like isoform X3 [Argiope bruennichi]